MYSYADLGRLREVGVNVWRVFVRHLTRMGHLSLFFFQNHPSLWFYFKSNKDGVLSMLSKRTTPTAANNCIRMCPRSKQVQAFYIQRIPLVLPTTPLACNTIELISITRQCHLLQFLGLLNIEPNLASWIVKAAHILTRHFIGCTHI